MNPNKTITSSLRVETSSFIRLKHIDYDLSHEFSTILRINPLSKEDPFSIFPNPAIHQVNYKLKGPSGRIDIFNLQGQAVLSMKLKSGEGVIDCSHLDKGMYLIQFNSSGHISTERLILN